MGGNASNILLLVLFIAIMYFLMIRPQKKKEKEDRAMREALVVGDEVMTIGGIKGKVVKVTEDSVVIATGADKTKIEFVKSAIASVKDANSAKQAPKKSAEPVEENGPEKGKKVTPKKLGKKSESEE